MTRARMLLPSLGLFAVLAMVGPAVAGTPKRSGPRCDTADVRPGMNHASRKSAVTKRSPLAKAARKPATDEAVVLRIENDSVIPDAVIAIVEIRAGKSKRA